MTTPSRCPKCESDDPAVQHLVGRPGQHEACTDPWHCTCTHGPADSEAAIECAFAKHLTAGKRENLRTLWLAGLAGVATDVLEHAEWLRGAMLATAMNVSPGGPARLRIAAKGRRVFGYLAVEEFVGPKIDCPLHGAPDDVVDVEIVDPYQDHYLAHQKRKAGQLAEILAERHSDRRFGDAPTDDNLAQIVRAAALAPSSCDRHGVSTHSLNGRDDKALLGGLLVGGVGWVHRAPVVFMLWADREAYKAPGEVAYMPYLDAGVVVGHMWLTATSLGLAAAYVNPNVRPENAAYFQSRFGFDGGIFCGALAVGQPHPSDALGHLKEDG